MVSLIKMVTDFHFLNIVQDEDGLFSLFELMSRENVQSRQVTKTPMLRKKQSSQISVRIMCVAPIRPLLGALEPHVFKFTQMLVMFPRELSMEYQLCWPTQVNNNDKTHKLTSYTLITLWMLYTIVLNLRPAFSCFSNIYKYVIILRSTVYVLCMRVCTIERM